MYREPRTATEAGKSLLFAAVSLLETESSIDTSGMVKTCKELIRSLDKHKVADSSSGRFAANRNQPRILWRDLQISSLRKSLDCLCALVRLVASELFIIQHLAFAVAVLAYYKKPQKRSSFQHSLKEIRLVVCNGGGGAGRTQNASNLWSADDERSLYSVGHHENPTSCDCFVTTTKKRNGAR